jgi:hypothetical protein
MSIRQGQLKIFTPGESNCTCVLELFDQDGSNPFPFSTLEDSQLLNVELESAMQIAGFANDGIENTLSRSEHPERGITVNIPNELGFIELQYEDNSAIVNKTYKVSVLIQYEEFPQIESHD